MSDKIIERVFQYLDFKGVPHTRFEKEIGLSNGYLATQRRRNADLGEGIIQKIIDNSLHLSLEWLITGKGQMINDNKNKGLTEVTKTTAHEGLPLIPMEAFAGIGYNTDTVIDLDTVEDRYVIPLFDTLGVDFLITVRGSSMYPKFSSGDVVACKFVQQLLFIQWNKIYVVNTKSQGVIIKRLRKSDVANCVSCRSDNNEYPDFDVPMEDIQNFALVVGAIRLD